MLGTQFIRQIIGLEPSPTLYYECRQCGHSAEVLTNECPQCGSHEIAAYDLESAPHS